jgi:hypothetical protein
MIDSCTVRTQDAFKEDVRSELPGETRVSCVRRLPFRKPLSERLANETFVYDVDIDDWGSHLESLGAIRIADRHQKVKPLFPDEGATLNQDL